MLEALTGIRRAGADIVITYHAKDVAKWLVARPRSAPGADGSAVPLDETDKKLLNLMQGSFALRADPFEGVAEPAGIPEEEVMGARPVPARQAHHPRDHADLRHARARLLARCSWPRRSTPANPHRAAQFINSHPGVTHNYLRNHDFNLWFTLAVEPDSKLGLDGTLDVMAAKTGAESIRQLPTLKLFKIRMDLEMEGGTDALQSAGEAVEPMELDPIELSDDDIEVIRATQGPMAVRSDAYGPPPSGSACAVDDVLARLESLRERGGLRRVAAILYHRRAGFSANGMGVWAVPDGEILDTGRRMAAYRGISHCYQRPTYADWPYSVFTMAHGRSKEECDAVLDTIAETTISSARRCTRAPSSRRSGCSTSPTTSSAGKRSTLLSASSLSDTRSAELYRRACTCCRAGSTRRSGRCGRSAATRSSSSAPPAPS